MLALVGGGSSSFLFIHVFFRITLLLTWRTAKRFWTAVCASGLMFLAFFLATQKSYWITLEVGLLYFAVLFIGNIVQQFKGFTFKTFLYFLVVTIILAFQGALSLKKFNDERRVSDQFRFGNKFLVDQDVLGEFLLNESSHKIASDPFIQSIFFSPFLSKNSIRQKIRQFYLNTYFNRYDIEIYLYNTSGEPYHPQVSDSFGEFNYEKDFNKNLLTQSPLFQRGVADNGFYHIGIEDQNGQSAVVTARIYPVFFLITNFAFLFVLGLVVVLLVLLIIGSTTWA